MRVLRETRKLSLREIRLLESHCKLGALREGELPSNATQTITFAMQIDPGKGDATVVVGIRMGVTYNEPDGGEPPLMVSANFGLRYGFSRPSSRKHLQEAIQQVATFNVWPYWREFVQSMTVRMGLPAFPVPLINPTRLEGPGTKTETPNPK
jgi:hypothetical protein